MEVFRSLTAEEEDSFRNWARENYVPFSEIKGFWHPSVQAECVLMNSEAGLLTPSEAYGMDANRILLEFMGAPVRNRRVEEELTKLFELIDNEEFDDARTVIATLEEKLGTAEPELTRASSLIRFLEGID